MRRASNDVVAMPQTGPGRYEVDRPRPAAPDVRRPSASTAASIDRFAVAGRYSPEFEQIGNDRAAMDALARATGGAVIEPAQTAPIDFRWPTRRVPLAACLAAAGAVFVAAGLVHGEREVT